MNDWTRPESRRTEHRSRDHEVERARNDVFDALAHDRRRRVLRSLSDASLPLSVADLARRVAARETGGSESATEPPGDVVERIHVSLHHAHLPKLDAVGLVEYDDDRQAVVATRIPDLPGL